MILHAADIHKSFRHPVLQGVTFRAAPGEIIGLAGENGSGKSTLLSILTGFVKPDQGTVTKPDNKDIGYVPQETALFDTLNVADNLRFWAAAYGLPRSAWQTALRDYFPEADKTLLRKKAAQLSGGMKKRLSIVLAGLHNPTFIIMDEPTAALDIGFKRVLQTQLAALRDAGRCAVFTSHQPDELLWCDRIYVLRDGVFVYEGPPHGLGNDFNAELYRLCHRK